MNRVFLAILISAAAAFGAEPRLVYTKSFPGSVPAYVEISVTRACAVRYKEATDDPDPIDLSLPKPDCDMMFDLADKLDRFSRPIESGLKVAFMGAKKFRYEGDATHEVEFNYSQDPNAKTLLDCFETIADSERAFIELERRVKFDKLGVNDALLQIMDMWDAHHMVAPEQYLPLLQRVAKNESYMRIAREKAAAIIEVIQAATPATPK